MKIQKSVIDILKAAATKTPEPRYLIAFTRRFKGEPTTRHTAPTLREILKKGGL